jgi:hypothetical protein
MPRAAVNVCPAASQRKLLMDQRSYLSDHGNTRLLKGVSRTMRPGTRVASFYFPVSRQDSPCHSRHERQKQKARMVNRGLLPMHFSVSLQVDLPGWKPFMEDRTDGLAVFLYHAPSLDRTQARAP